MGRPATQRLGQFAFASDAVGGRAILRQRVAATGFGIAAFQLGARAVEEQGFDVVAVAQAGTYPALTEEFSAGLS